MAKYAYPAIFHSEEEGGFSVSFPDLPGNYTQGEDIAEGMYMANDLLAFALYDMEKSEKAMPTPTPLSEIKTEGNEFATYIYADTLEYSKKFNNKAVKKTLSIPEWLNEIALEKGVNFSQVLQDALKAQLDIV